MRRWDKLNDKQLQVLNRIATGEQLTTPADAAARHSARALADRGLVTIDRSRGRWQAGITDAGQFYLQHGHHPDDPAHQPSTAGAPASRAKQPPSAANQSRAARTPRREPAGVVRERRRAQLADWLQQLATSPQIFLPPMNEDELQELRRTLAFAKREQLTPAGKGLGHYRVIGDRVCLHLFNVSRSAPRPPASPIAVPDEVANLHPLLSHLTEPHTALGVSSAAAPRALRIMHALLTEAERRGYDTTWAEEPAEGVEIRISGHPHTVQMAEEYDHREVLPTADELNQQQVYSWQRVSSRPASLPSGRLVMSVGGNSTFRTQRRWADRTRWTLEDRLGEVLATVEALAADEEHRRIEQEEQRLDRQHRWEQAMADAERQFHERRCIKELTKQLTRWEMAGRIRQFRDAAVQAGQIDSDWLAWMTRYADELDPTAHTIHGPADQQPTKEDLRPYLRGWSPYGPGSR